MNARASESSWGPNCTVAIKFALPMCVFRVPFLLYSPDRRGVKGKGLLYQCHKTWSFFAYICIYIVLHFLTGFVVLIQFRSLFGNEDKRKATHASRFIRARTTQKKLRGFHGPENLRRTFVTPGSPQERLASIVRVVTWTLTGPLCVAAPRCAPLW